MFEQSTVAVPYSRSVASPIADPQVMSSIPARSHSSVEIDHEIFSTVILLLPLIQDGLLSVTNGSICTEYWLTAWSKHAQEKVGFGELTVLT